MPKPSTLQKQMHSQTRMVFMLEDGDRIEGAIEWYDTDAIKVRNGSVRTLDLQDIRDQISSTKPPTQQSLSASPNKSQASGSRAAFSKRSRRARPMPRSDGSGHTMCVVSCVSSQRSPAKNRCASESRSAQCPQSKMASAPRRSLLNSSGRHHSHPHAVALACLSLASPPERAGSPAWTPPQRLPPASPPAPAWRAAAGAESLLQAMATPPPPRQPPGHSSRKASPHPATLRSASNVTALPAGRRSPAIGSHPPPSTLHAVAASGPHPRRRRCGHQDSSSTCAAVVGNSASQTSWRSARQSACRQRRSVLAPPGATASALPPADVPPSPHPAHPGHAAAAASSGPGQNASINARARSLTSATSRPSGSPSLTCTITGSHAGRCLAAKIAFQHRFRIEGIRSQPVDRLSGKLPPSLRRPPDRCNGAFQWWPLLSCSVDRIRSGEGVRSLPSLHYAGVARPRVRIHIQMVGDRFPGSLMSPSGTLGRCRFKRSRHPSC